MKLNQKNTKSTTGTTGTTSPKRQPPKTKVIIKERYAKLANRLAAKINKIAAKFVSEAEINSALLDAGAALFTASTKIDALPETWTARKTRERVSTVVAEGTKVNVREAKKEKIAGLLEDAELTGLTVEKVVGSRLRVRTTTGIVLVLPRGIFSVA